MRTIFAEYNPGSDCALNTLAIDEPLEYARLYLDGNLQMWVDAEDLMLSRLVDTFFSRTSWTMLLYAENHSISVA